MNQYLRTWAQFSWVVTFLILFIITGAFFTTERRWWFVTFSCVCYDTIFTCLWTFWWSTPWWPATIN